MLFGKLNMIGNQQIMPQQSQVFQQPVVQRQFGEGNYTRMVDQMRQRFLPMMGGQGGLPMPGIGRVMNRLGGMPASQGIPGGSQGYVTPGYPPQGFGLQQPQHISPTQGYPVQGYATQGYTQGYEVQKPVQPTWEEPKKAGIKGFISNFMAKRKM